MISYNPKSRSFDLSSRIKKNLSSSRRKNLEDSKDDITNIDDCIAKAHELETTALDNILAWPTASSFSNTSSEYLGT